MPELRTDYLTGRSVLVAENRALRPNEFAGEPSSVAVLPLSETKAHPLSTCPFCAGNESKTPPVVYQKLDAAGHWQIRVVPNAYPALNNLSGAPVGGVSEADKLDKLQPGIGLGETSHNPTPHPVPSALGVHEVIIESSGHIDRMSALSVAELRDILDAYVARLQHWRQDRRLHYGLVFKNQGPKAGASLAHVHSQLIALPVVPPAVEAELTRAADQFQKTAHCPYCTLIVQEQSAKSRIVADHDGLIAFCPFASWQPHEVWLMPTAHAASFELAEQATLDRLAPALHRLFKQLQSVAPDAQFNMLLRTAPWHGDHDNSFHWRIELLPRVNSLAGFEVATGVHINPLPPERAALNLRGD